MTPEDTGEPVESGSPDRKGSIRERILATAVELFGELGYTETTMERIAVEAQVARATVFNHFPQKELLLGEVARSLHTSFGDLLRKDTDPALPLRNRILDAQERWSLAYARDVDAALPLVRAWVYAGGPLLAVPDSTAEVLTEMIAEAQDDGSLPRAGSPASLGQAMNDALTGAMIRWTKQEEPTAESLRDVMLAAVHAIKLE
ncbi:TetR/AcrR family transcriptional regulator [Williamsia maris]|uniref:Transcriptional regulator, TetR family n=1 Tax=Williamsia maris TaxID=72806 RepID=A0ABT1HCQ1_9NOCA|nr:TetR/AcrR family transcriptional regulator [Williamsia maris]MCP2176039.1 transcriptional regulator, TetR family [Williamsia maris]